MAYFGERNCLVCGKVFEPQRAQQVCCGLDCQKERTRRNSREWKQKHHRLAIDQYKALPQRVTLIEQQFALLEKFIRHIHGMTENEMQIIYGLILARKIDATSQKEVLPEKVVDTEPESEPENALLSECARMNLKTSGKLPCGKRTECFYPKRCDKCPPKAKKVEVNTL